MAEQKDKGPRQIAATVLDQFKPSRSYTAWAADILNRHINQTTRKQQATDLVMGTLRNRQTIDLVIEKTSNRKIKQINTRLINIVRIGAYELLYCPQTAEFAIVNEAAAQAKTIGGQKAAGFVNALLRQITRSIKNRTFALAKADPKKTIPHSTTAGCELTFDIFTNPKKNLADNLSGAFSLPKWLIKTWLKDFGPANAKKICFAANRKAGIYIRPNELKISIEQLAQKLQAAEIDFKPVPDENMIRLESPGPIEKLPGFTDGLFTVQDVTASQAVKLLNPKPTWTIADICAAPGGKTTQLAEIMKDKGRIIATDIDSKRLKKVKKNCQRLKITSVKIIGYDNLKDAGKFDAILLDVPCSNTGVLSKRPEVRLRLTPAAVARLTKPQNDLLEMSAEMLKPNGRICYSTCSIQNDENAQLVRQFLTKHKNFTLETQKLTLPQTGDFDCDGGYTAILIKK